MILNQTSWIFPKYNFLLYKLLKSLHISSKSGLSRRKSKKLQDFGTLKRWLFSSHKTRDSMKRHLAVCWPQVAKHSDVWKMSLWLMFQVLLKVTNIDKSFKDGLRLSGLLKVVYVRNICLQWPRKVRKLKAFYLEYEYRMSV